MVQMELSKQWVVSVLFLSELLCLVTSEITPVFLWTNKGSLPNIETRVGQHLSNDKFSKHVIKHLSNEAKGNIVAFLHDKLSLDDITKHADVYSDKSDGNLFKNLKNAIEDHTSLELPSVNDAASSIQDLVNNFKGKVHYLNEPHDLKSLPLGDGERHMVMVHLPSDGETHTESLKKNDEIVGKVNNQLKKMKDPFTALYTGQESSRTPAETLNMGRHLLATPEKKKSVSTRFFNYTGCAYMYFTGLNITLTEVTPSQGNKRSTSEIKYNRNLVAQDVTLEFNDDPNPCKNGSTMLKIKAADTTGVVTKFELTINVNTSFPFDWRVQNMNLDVAINNPKYQVTTDLVTRDLEAAKGFSYHCSDPPTVAPSNGTVLPSGHIMKVSLIFKGFQLQVNPKGFKDRKFGPPDDCVGFFSIPIWSGIITGIVIAMILTFGITMIMNISTMDRFDDPKGKQLIVNVAE